MSTAEEPIHDLLVDLAGLPAKGRVADAGCGAGPTLAAFARRLPEAHLIGLDRDENALAVGRRLLDGHPEAST